MTMTGEEWKENSRISLQLGAWSGTGREKKTAKWNIEIEICNQNMIGTKIDVELGAGTEEQKNGIRSWHAWYMYHCVILL